MPKPPDGRFFSGGILAGHPIVEFVQSERRNGVPAKQVAEQILERWRLIVDRHTLPRIANGRTNECRVCLAEFYSQRDSYEYCPYCVTNNRLRASKINRVIKGQKPKVEVDMKLRGWGY